MIPSSDTLQRASAILSEIEALQAELVSLFSVTSSAAAPAAAPKRRGRPPGSGKAAAAAAAAPKAPKMGKRERRMSPEGRARIAAAAKARWARFHAERKKADRS